MTNENPNQQYTWSENELKTIVSPEFKENEYKKFVELMQSDGIKQRIESFLPGTIVHGRVVNITKDHFVVDVGMKSQGLIDKEEFNSVSDEVEVGSDVEVLIDALEHPRTGRLVLSFEKAHRLRQWEHIVNNCTEGSIVRGHVKTKVKGGLVVDIGVDAFLPGSQVDNKRVKSLDEFVGQTLEFKILKINRERKNVVVSRRAILEIERINKKSEVLAQMTEGDIVKGVITNIVDFGVFLDINGIVGMMHITDITWKRIKHPSDIIEVGQELEVMVLTINQEKGRVGLGLKQMQPNPWIEIEKKYEVGTKVTGKITSILPYGALMEIEDGFEGLIHASQISWSEVVDISDKLTVGEVVEAVVLNVQKDEGKISLGMRQLQKNPWDDVNKKYKLGDKVKATVKNLTSVGAIVDLEDGFEATIYTSDISWLMKVAHPSEILKRGDVVDAVVLSINQENRKMMLGMKQLTEDPWETIEKTIPVGSVVSGNVVKISAFGATVKLESGMQGLIHVTELTDKPFGKVEEVIRMGEEVKAKVISLDTNNKRIQLSLKELTVEQQNVDHDDIVVNKNENQ